MVMERALLKTPADFSFFGLNGYRFKVTRPHLVDGFPGAGAMSSRRKETRVRRQGT